MNTTVSLVTGGITAALLDRYPITTTLACIVLIAGFIALVIRSINE